MLQKLLFVAVSYPDDGSFRYTKAPESALASLALAYSALSAKLLQLIQTQDDDRPSKNLVHSEYAPERYCHVRLREILPPDKERAYVDFTRVFDPDHWVFSTVGNKEVPLLDAIVSPYASLAGVSRTVNKEKVYELFCEHFQDLVFSTFPAFAPTQVYRHFYRPFSFARDDWDEARRGTVCPPLRNTEKSANHSLPDVLCDPLATLEVPIPPLSLAGLRFSVARPATPVLGVDRYFRVLEADTEWSRQGLVAGEVYAMHFTGSAELPLHQLLRFNSRQLRHLFAVEEFPSGDYAVVALPGG